MIFHDPDMDWAKFRKEPRLVLYWYYHRLTGYWRGSPSFIIIGVQKGGTTSLFNYLVQHPDVKQPFRKEIKYFDCNYTEGFSWYRANFPPKMKLRDGLITGEASPHYFPHPLAAERIAQKFPTIKLIVLLRNPVDRAYSHYQHMVRGGNETLSFEQAIEAEPARLEGEEERIIADVHYPLHNYMNYTYLTLGMYRKYFQHWFKVFPREQLLILKSEDLYSHPSETYKETLNFLGLRAWEPEGFPIFNKQGQYDTMYPATRKKLVEFFEPHNKQLYAFLGRDFGWDK
jgi:hypothetical protein